MSAIMEPITVLGGLGFLFGIILSLASQIFAVETDPKAELIMKALPGANCGACGFPGCEGLAYAIRKGQAPVTACSVGGTAVAETIADIMGTDAADIVRKTAVVLCGGDCEKAKDKYIYDGIEDCRVENILAEGSKACRYGCLGCGTCQDACEYDAIQIIDGLAVIDKDKCVACEACIGVCPKSIIEMVPYEQEAIIKCMSQDHGKVVRNNCSVGCIGCGICVKNCPVDAIDLENKLAKIDYEKCIDCGICAEKCPTNAISSALKDDKKIAQ